MNRSVEIADLTDAIASIGEMLGAVFLFGIGVFASDWYSGGTFVILAIWIFGSYRAQKNRKLYRERLCSKLVGTDVTTT
ncbi:hypothetical protein [Duganella vulcania]|uniref:hypothetical protein n=1 Tax=Duganella vulcania TaxID=2692166 RepID=UPI001C2CEA3C|nr:hypothetical protein [Duganella vulcania]